MPGLNDRVGFHRTLRRNSSVVDNLERNNNLKARVRPNTITLHSSVSVSASGLCQEEAPIPSIVSTEFGSQGKPRTDFIKHLGDWGMSSFLGPRRRQRTLAADPKLSLVQPVETRSPKNTMSPLASERNTSESLLAQAVNQYIEESADKNDAAGGVKQHMDANAEAQKEYERLDSTKPHLSPSCASVGEKKPNAARRVLARLKRAKTRLDRSETFFPSRHKDHTIEQPTKTTSTSQLPIHSSVCDARHPGIVQRADQDPCATATRTGGELKLAYGKDTEQKESEEIERLRRDLSESHSQIADLRKRCEAQSRDLESSNGFLNATDKSSDSDVIHALQRLNAEIQQSTTYMADCLAEDFEFENVAINPTEAQISAVQRASETIGQVLAKSLGTKTSANIPMLLQIAFQAYLASALAQTASSWVFEPSHNKFINSIYQSLHGVEAQAVSGRWRSLARLYIVHSWVNHPESLVKGIITGFSDIMLATGCTAPQSDIIWKITSKFEQKIASLVKLAGRLNKLFDEIISSDFEILVAQPGEKFESKNMEDTDGGQTGVQDASVLCATHLGLVKRMPVGTLWEKGKKQKMMVLKAKVLLESFLNPEDY